MDHLKGGAETHSRDEHRSTTVFVRGLLENEKARSPIPFLYLFYGLPVLLRVPVGEAADPAVHLERLHNFRRKAHAQEHGEASVPKQGVRVGAALGRVVKVVVRQ